MIAPQRVAVAPRHAERVKTATRRRNRRTRRRAHAPLLAVGLLTAALSIPLLAYVTLTANVTSLNYAVAREESEKTALLEETQRLDDRILQLQSPERLAALATLLRLHDPHVYAVVHVPQPKAQPRPTGFALLGSWLSGAR